jgi:hypothetical protein
MDTTLYHIATPETSKDVYSEYDQIHFGLDFEGRQIIMNSIRFEGEVKVYKTGTTDLDDPSDVSFDPKIGAHSLISTVVVTFQNQGVIENIIEYPRLVKMKTDASKSANDMLASNYVCELRAPTKDVNEAMVRRKNPKAWKGAAVGGTNPDIADIPAGAVVYPDFSIVPHLCLNQAPAGSRLSFRTSGTARVSLTLERNMGVLYGRSVDANYNYKLSNIRMSFMTVPDTGKPQPIEMRTSLCIKSSLTSNQANLSSKVPAICDSMSMSYLPYTQEYQPTYSNTQLSNPPDVTSIQFLFNDATNQYITYLIKDKDEMVKRGLDGLSAGKSNDVNLNKLSANEGYIHGLNWGQFIDLSKQKFNIQVNSAISNINPHHIWMYFNSIVNV